MLIDHYIFEFAYENAMRDATLRTAYNGDKNKLRKNTKSKELIKEYIDMIIKGETPCFYSAEKIVENSFSKNEPFTFGNTQKLINMTVKYMFISTYSNQSLKQHFNNCHCPMDGKMIKMVKKKAAELSELNDILSKYGQRNRGWKSFLKETWSTYTQEDVDRYNLFQDLIKCLADHDGISPIEYDYKYWGK